MMTSEEARAIEREYNDMAERGCDLWEQVVVLGAECQKILDDLKAQGVRYDEIALLFGSELQIDLNDGD